MNYIKLGGVSKSGEIKEPEIPKLQIPRAKEIETNPLPMLKSTDLSSRSGEMGTAPDKNQRETLIREFNGRISASNGELAGKTGKLIQSLPKISAMAGKLPSKALLKFDAGDGVMPERSWETADDVLQEFLDSHLAIQLAIKHYNLHSDTGSIEEIFPALCKLEQCIAKVKRQEANVIKAGALVQAQAAMENVREVISKYERIVGTAKGGAKAAIGKQRQRMGKLEQLCDELESNDIEMTLERLDEICQEIAQIEEELSGGNLELHGMCTEHEIQQLPTKFESYVSDALGRFGIGKTKTLAAANMSPLEVHEVCECLAWKVAEWCFDDRGNIDRGKAVGLRNFLAKGENFRGFPYNQFPYFEHMRSQTFAVLGHLVKSPSELENILNDSNEAVPGFNGKAILATMGKVLRASDLKPQAAILLSLFSPHRQTPLPTCTINSIINADLLNHPERLAGAYASILTDKSIVTPSGYVIHQLPVVNGRVTVDLTKGGKAKNMVFGEIVKLVAETDPAKKVGAQKKADERTSSWQSAGIEYDYRHPNELNLQVRDLNDIYFANFFKETSFGNSRADRNGEYGTMYIYAGFTNWRNVRGVEINVATSEALPRGIAELQRQARELRKRNPDAEYMRTCTCTNGAGEHEYHAENISISRLLALDLNAMQDGEIYCIGDRNWAASRGTDIPRLAIRRITGPDGSPAFQFGTVHNAENPCCKIQFFPKNLQYFQVYNDMIRRLPGT